jgi:hypothetical protein
VCSSDLRPAMIGEGWGIRAFFHELRGFQLTTPDRLRNVPY